MHRLVWPCCSTNTRTTLPADVEGTRYRRKLSALVSLLGSAFPLSISKTQVLLDQLLGVKISCVKFVPFRLALGAASVTARKDDAPAAYQAAITNVAGLASFSGG